MRGLFFLFFWAGISHAQVPLFEKDSAALFILNSLPSREPFDSSQLSKTVKSPFIYLISQNDVYRLFGYTRYKEFAGFDFSNSHILGSFECRQCLRTCRHDQGDGACHRNRCRKEWVWRVRDNARAFAEIPSETRMENPDSARLNGRIFFGEDTLVNRVSDTRKTDWYTNAGGDCHARFTYAVYRDRYLPVLLLKEWNHYGGCRAAGYWNFTISFDRPEKEMVPVKATILVDSN